MHSLNSDNVQSIISVPLAKFIHITEGENASGQAKFEGSIPEYLARCRATVNLIKDAEEQGSLKPGMEIIEPAFDSAGVVMAYVAADRGYNLTLTVPETMNYDSRKILADLGANVILTSATEGQNGAIKRAEEIASAEPQRCFLARKFKSFLAATPENEIRNGSGGIISVSVSSEKTSGTITGQSRYTQHIKGKHFFTAT